MGCTQAERKGVAVPSSLPPRLNSKFVQHRFCIHDIKLLRDLPFSRNQQLVFAYDWYIIILKNIINLVCLGGMLKKQD